MHLCCIRQLYLHSKHFWGFTLLLMPPPLQLPPLVCRAAEPAAPSSRFAFEGPLAPVVMVAPVGGNTPGGAGTIPWRCAIDSFIGEEEVPQVSVQGCHQTS